MLPLQLGNSKYPDSHVLQPYPNWFGGQTENLKKIMSNAKSKVESLHNSYQFQRQN